MKALRRTSPRARAPEVPPASPKSRGELAEARFLAKAMELGFVVSKPFGESARYDFVVDAGGGLRRVQVKSSWKSRRDYGSYNIHATPAQLRGQHVRPYRRNEIDFIAAFLAPEHAWFIIPVHEVLTRERLTLSTQAKHPFARYREAWELLRPPPAAQPRRGK